MDDRGDDRMTVRGAVCGAHDVIVLTAHLTKGAGHDRPVAGTTTSSAIDR